MSAIQRSALAELLQTGAAEIWHAHPSLATPYHYDVHSYTVGKELSLGDGWRKTFNELSDYITPLFYNKYPDDGDSSLRAGIAAGLYIVDVSGGFQADPLSVVYRPLNALVTSTKKQTRVQARRACFEYAMQGFDLIAPQFDRTNTELDSDKLIADASRNSVFEMGVGLMLHAALDSAHTTTPSPSRISVVRP